MYTKAFLLMGAITACVWAQSPFLLRKDIVVAQQFGAGATGGPTTLGDFNGDGRPDIVICTARGPAVLLNRGEGNFASPIRTSSTCGTVTGDFNSDGRLDLVAGDGLLLGRGDGTFLPPRVIGPDGISPRVVVSGDFNSDGRLDLVFYTGPASTWEDEAAATTIHSMLGVGDGTFTVSWVDSPSPGRVRMLGVTVVADFNRDGRADLAATDGTGGLVVFLGQGDGTFQSSRRTATGEDTAYVVVGDFNRDGLLDIASAFSIALGQGDGTFISRVRHPAADLRNEFGAPIALIVSAAADFDGDGHLDLAGAPFSLPPFLKEVWVLPGKGDGSMSAPVHYAVGMWPQGAVAADFDGDGRMDLASSGPMSNTLSLLLSRAAGGPALNRAVSAASRTAIVSAESLATLYVSTTVAAPAQALPPWPTMLGGLSLEVRDANGTAHLAPLLYVSSLQINFQVPAGTALGEATLTIIDQRGRTLAGGMHVDAVAPAIFTVDGQLMPLPRPAAIAVRIEPDGSQTNLPLLNCVPNGDCFPVPLPDPDARPIYVSLFGTGFRAAGASRIECTSNGEPLSLVYAGPQATLGVDQINIRAPRGSPGLGTVVCSINGVVANPVWL